MRWAIDTLSEPLAPMAIPSYRLQGFGSDDQATALVHNSPGRFGYLASRSKSLLQQDKL